MNKLKHLISSIMICDDEDEPALGGHRNVTPSFQVLMRQSSGRFHKRRYRCVLIPLLLLLILTLIGSILFVYAFDDVFQVVKLTNSSSPLAENETTIVLASIEVNNIENNKCPSDITGVGTYNKVTALFGGVNEHGVELTSIELIPDYNCSNNFPRLVIRIFLHFIILCLFIADKHEYYTYFIIACCQHRVALKVDYYY